jgi:hypothetical protein
MSVTVITVSDEAGIEEAANVSICAPTVMIISIP